jgi:type IV secretion system protein VirD4
LGDFKAGGKGFTDILETVNSECAFLRDPAISDSFSGNDFTFEVLGARVSTIAICIPMNLINESRKVCRVMAAVALGSLLTPDRPRNVEIELFFDEAASYGALEPLLNGYATARAFGVRIWSFWTSIADGEVLYGERFRSLLGNASVQIFMGGTRDVRTAQMMSDKSGYRTITTHGKNVNYDQRTGWPVVSMNKGQARCEVLSIREAQEVPAGEALMWVRGVRGVIRCKFIPYFKQWRWFFRYRKNPLY